MKVEKQTENMCFFKDTNIGDCICHEREYFLVIAPIIDETGDYINIVRFDGHSGILYSEDRVKIVNAKVVIE